jgi:hypothetical protein
MAERKAAADGVAASAAVRDAIVRGEDGVGTLLVGRLT